MRYRSPSDRRLRARVEVRGPREVQTVAGIELASAARGLSRATLSHAAADSPSSCGWRWTTTPGRCARR
ncbi:MAG: hypothetical protein R3A52_30640 [Polyangiales bacterium]